MVTELNQVRLGNHVTIRTGKLDANASSTDGKYPFFTCSKTPLRITSYSYDCECVLVAGNGDLNVKYYNGKFDAYQRTYIIESIDKRQLDVRYLFHFLDVYVYVLRSQSIGGVIKYIKLGNLTEAQIPLPPLSEQKRIAGVLDKICEMKRNVEARLQKLDLLVKSRFNEMFGDPVTNPKGWKIYTLGDYIDFLTSGSRGWAKYYSDDGEYFITIKNVKDTRISVTDMQHITPPPGAEAERTKVKEGDLLISITADLGRTGIVTKEIAEHGAYINQHLTCIRLKSDNVLPIFVAYYMESAAGKIQFQNKNQSAVKAGLNFAAIRSLHFYLPPLPLQREFAAFVEKVEEMKATVRKELEKVDHLYRAKLQEYFG